MANQRMIRLMVTSAATVLALGATACGDAATNSIAPAATVTSPPATAAPVTTPAKATTNEPLDLGTISAIWTTLMHLSPRDLEILYPAFSPSVQRQLETMATAIAIGVAP